MFEAKLTLLQQSHNQCHNFDVQNGTITLRQQKCQSLRINIGNEHYQWQIQDFP